MIVEKKNSKNLKNSIYIHLFIYRIQLQTKIDQSKLMSHNYNTMYPHTPEKLFN